MAPARNAVHEEESAEVELLRAEANKYAAISRKMEASLARLQETGHALENALEPVYNNTQELQIINTNIDKVLDAIDKMLIPSEDKGKEERIIQAGPEAAGLVEYLASLKRIDRTLSQLSSTGLRANQQTIGDFNELLSEGSERLQKLFRSILVESAQPLEPLHYITKQIPFPNIPQESVSKLGSIDSFISSPTARELSYNSRESPSIRMYSEIRGMYISVSMQTLSTASITTSKRKGTDELYRSGTSGIATYASGLEGVFLAEFQSISAIFPRENWGLVFDNTCRKALADFAKTLRELNMHIKQNMTTDCYLAYEIVEIVTSTGLRLDEKTVPMKLPFADALKPVRETAKASLPEMLEDIRRRVSGLQALPYDGATISFTTDIMTRLQMMATYIHPLGSLLASVGDGSWTSNTSTSAGASTSPPSLKSLDVGLDGKQLLGHYIMDAIETLLTSLEAKSRMLLKGKFVSGVFMANTVAVIDRMIRSSDLSQILSSGGAAAKIESWRKKGNSAYLDSWREPCSALMDVQYTNRGARPPSGGSGPIDSSAVIKQLSGKDKDSIKEKFKNFNTSFEDLSARHKGLHMEREVRSQLAREIQAMIEPMYARFWDRYHELDKGKGKYVKYDKGSLSAQLANLG
ncbi:MAG: hypothetical protein LQ342_003932 [Letrouitia transgressa]|nr:MAG: hypothetical protein LQ342_003932 [Letrouitia transgressa]